MLIELGDLRPQLWWREHLDCPVTMIRTLTIITRYRPLGWVIVNYHGQLGGDGGDSVAELANPVRDLPAFDPPRCYFAARAAAARWLLSRVTQRLSDDMQYSRWADGRDPHTGYRYIADALEVCDSSIVTEIH